MGAIAFAKGPIPLKRLWQLSFPLILSMLSATLLNFCDKFFLSHYSLASLKACAGATSLLVFFQTPLIWLAWAVQILVGRCVGAKQEEQIGSYVWQMIWCSLLSMLLTLPLSPQAASLYMGGTEIEKEGEIYFYCLMFFNFFFPLVAALNGFFIGIGKTKVVITTTLCAHLVNILLDYLLIFGIKGFLPPLGILGSAIATGIAQGVQGLLLLGLFFKREYRLLYHNFDWRLRWDRLKETLSLGIPNLTGKIALLFGYLVLDRIILQQGGSYLLATAVGLSIMGVFSGIYEGIGQAIISEASYLVGANKEGELWGLLRASFLLTLCIQAILALPLLLFPAPFLSFFLKGPEELEMLQRCCYWLWGFHFFEGLSRAAQGILNGFGDLVFIMYNKIISIWVTDILPTWAAIYVWHWQPDLLWGILTNACLIDVIIYQTRAVWKIRHRPRIASAS